ncbi:heparan sulfate 2-O-sulfotransferase pipe isoform X6 [Haematobia irritans]|uniref:heparan sulfate 2-O-sulfotransferase pipe isoform X6 n=1 Tax=Haematobia irritans TaxID=7368 RepID=UPI003F50D129
MSLLGEKNFKMKMRDVETAFKYRRFPYPKRSVELIALLAISCTFFLFMHTNKLNSRLKEMEMKLQPSEFSALGLTGNNHLDGPKHEDTNTLHGTYQYLKSTGQLYRLHPRRLNNTKYADMEVLFFNRVAKVGSEALMELLQHMAPLNDMKVLTQGPLNISPRTRTLKQQIIQANWISDLSPGTVYIEHCNWLNFTALKTPKPIMINLVRDPVERMISWYFYVRGSYKNALYYKKFPDAPVKSEEWFKKNFNQCVRSGDPECQYVPYSVIDSEGNHKRQSLFFCGHDQDCLPFDSPHAIQIAKDNVERDYAVVGSWEDTNVTLTVFEHYIPRFFKGVHEVFEAFNDNVTNRNKNHRKPHIDEDVKAMIRKNFTNEYDFYHFCKQRLYKQYIALNIDKNLRIV